jgi:hypothetical protein
MSSTSRNEVWLSAAARAFLAQLNPPEQRKLALLLLVLRKNAWPDDSRPLAPDGIAEEAMRVWPAGGYEILYRAEARVVEIGVIRRRP